MTQLLDNIRLLNWGAIQTGLACIFITYCICFFAHWFARQPYRQGVRVIVIMATPALIRSANNFIGYTTTFDTTPLGEFINLITGWLPLISFMYIAYLVATNKFTHAREDSSGPKSND